MKRMDVLRIPRSALAASVVMLGALAISGSPERRANPRPDWATVQLGRELFTHRWEVGDALAKGDGLGPVFNEVSCAACHLDPALGGSGPVQKNAVLFDVRKLVNVQREPTVPCSPDHVQVQVPTTASLRHGGIHGRAIAPEYQESRELLARAFEGQSDRLIELSGRNTPALFGAGLIDQIPDWAILQNVGGGKVAAAVFEVGDLLRSSPAASRSSPANRSDKVLAGLVAHDNIRGRANRLPDGRIGRFGWRADAATLQEFTEAACANELGLGNPGHAQAVSLANPDYTAPALDLSRQQCEAITAFIRTLPRPVEEESTAPEARSAAARGKQLFTAIGCAQCHVPDLGSAEGIYSDLLLHRMTDPRRGPYGVSLDPEFDPSERTRPSASEWRTPPLWGVADSAPYMHDGKAATLEAAIRAHAGAARPAEQRFRNDLPPEDREALLAFLGTLRAPVEARRVQPVVASTQ